MTWEPALRTVSIALLRAFLEDSVLLAGEERMRVRYWAQILYKTARRSGFVADSGTPSAQMRKSWNSFSATVMSILVCVFVDDAVSILESA